MPNQIRDITTSENGSFDYIFERNVTFKPKSVSGLVRCNVYRPKDVERSPVLMTYGPYGKDTHTSEFLPHAWHDINPTQQSQHSAFEVPDPKFWTARGYAVVRADEIGIGQSPGFLDTMSASTSDVFAELIDWAADQPWSNGKVGLLGISYFAGSQWRVAARRPRGLACIIPYEGMADYYRDRCRHGGILLEPFLQFWMGKQVRSNQYGLAGRSIIGRGPNTIEGDLNEVELKQNRADQDEDNLGAFFRDDEYYASREYNLEDIEVPLLSFGNWSNLVIHLRGNVEGYMLAGSRYKFLRIGSGRHDLPFYSEPEVQMQESFLSAFLKEDDFAGWTTGKQPKITYQARKGPFDHKSIESATGTIYSWRDAPEWPLPNTQYIKYYLNPDLGWSPNQQSVDVSTRISYPAMTTLANPFYHRFTTAPFDKETEITGHIVAHVNLSVTRLPGGSTPQDIDVFFLVRQWDANGVERTFTGTIGDAAAVTRGCQRISLRKVNDKHPHHQDYRPYRDYFSTDVLPVIPGEIYPVDVEIWPTNVVLLPGEMLSIEISGGDTGGIGPFVHEGGERTAERFAGTNHLHWGPKYSNWVSLPIIPS
ncbi:Alpha/Beta hydrolase protein [Boeremia exigua]|uniref:Alpha/Beta hydrolase protein n=1 Tax=Boeremia exigua TaxID=749465 RepID=UPI001E8EF44C|nr:Alpha/Beta hydrolase protein [Boeremia exigua]KAH6619051.1 Alpha/Beta hydrolase protein [Boeremia exigua]